MESRASPAIKSPRCLLPKAAPDSLPSPRQPSGPDPPALSWREHAHSCRWRLGIRQMPGTSNHLPFSPSLSQHLPCARSPGCPSNASHTCVFCTPPAIVRKPRPPRPVQLGPIPIHLQILRDGGSPHPSL